MALENNPLALGDEVGYEPRHEATQAKPVRSDDSALAIIVNLTKSQELGKMVKSIQENTWKH